MLVEYESQPQELTKNDIDKYFDSPTVKFTLNEKEDQTEWIYKWYNGNAWEYPLMARIARDYMAIPTSEADVERLFSDGRDILGVRRWAIQGKTLRALTLLKDELR
jgi:hAT family C-terminal dimerisation region